MNGANISESMVARGLATVVRHRKDDEDRSAAYDALLVAEGNISRYFNQKTSL